MSARLIGSILFIFFAYASGLSARAGEVVWILNSDHSVNRYRVTEQAFRESWTGTTVTIDLGRLTLDQGEVDWRRSQKPPDAVYCIGSKAYIVARQYLKDVPIVLSSAINWELFPHTTNDLVVANELPAQAHMTLFRHIFPQVKRIGVLYSQRYREQWIKDTQAAGQEMGLHIVGGLVNRSTEAPRATKALMDDVDALWLIADPTVLGWADTTREIFAIAHAAGIPVFTYSTAFANLGATLIIAPDDATVGRQAAGLLMDRHNESATFIRVQNPIGSEISLNMQRAEEYGTEINTHSLNMINQMIEARDK